MSTYASRFYKSQRWRDTREGYLSSVNHLCEKCLEMGRYTPAVIVHHKVYISERNINDPNITLNWNNLEAVCRGCHAVIHENTYKERDNAKNKKRYFVEKNGYVKICDHQAPS